MEKNRNSVVRFNKEALKRDVAYEGKQLVDHCLRELQDTAGHVAERGTRALFEYLIDWVNSKTST